MAFDFGKKKNNVNEINFNEMKFPCAHFSLIHIRLLILLTNLGSKIN